jgi:hypothetical protein
LDNNAEPFFFLSNFDLIDAASKKQEKSQYFEVCKGNS